MASVSFSASLRKRQADDVILDEQEDVERHLIASPAVGELKVVGTISTYSLNTAAELTVNAARAS